MGANYVPGQLNVQVTSNPQALSKYVKGQLSQIQDALSLSGQVTATLQTQVATNTASIATINGQITTINTTLGTLGTAAFLNVGTGANQIVQLTASDKLPAVDGSALTNLPLPSLGRGLTSASNAVLVDPSFLRNYLAGIQITGTTTTTITVGAGVCVDDTNAILVSYAGGTLSPNGANGANGLDTGSLVASQWYHVFLIMQTNGTTALFASTSITPTLPSPYTLKRRLFSFRTDVSAHILSIVQLGDTFLWGGGGFADLNSASVGTASRSLVTVTVPRGVQVDALFNCQLSGAAGTTALAITSPDEPDQTAASYNSVAILGSGVCSDQCTKRTNTSAQVGFRLSAAATVYVFTFGWVDTRGRFS